MKRLPLTFECRDCVLTGTLDLAEGHTGLLIVSGGNEIRAGAFNGQARLAKRIAAAGFPVFRFDRRGTGDSDGENHGFLDSRDDIAAAIDAFRTTVPHMDSVIAFGNCDAASALALHHDLPLDGLILSNPWTMDEDDGVGDAPTPETARARYAQKLRNPLEILRLLTGKVDFRKLFRGLRSAVRTVSEPSSLADRMATALDESNRTASILLAGNDRTAQVFASRWNDNANIQRCVGAGHSYAEPHAQEWLVERILERLRA